MAIKEQRTGSKLRELALEITTVEETRGPTQFISDDDMLGTIQVIVNSLPSSVEGYDQACKLYGSDFFRDETPVFKWRLSQALITKFAGMKNNYWQKLVDENKPVENPAVG